MTGIAAITMVKNEIDIFPWTLQRIASQVDVVYVLDNGSTDGTRDYLSTTPSMMSTRGDRDGCRIVTIDDPEPGYWQSRKMTALAHQAAAETDATWIVPFDADESIWLPDLDGIPPVYGQVYMRPWWFVPHDDDSNLFASPIERFLWRLPDAQPMPKVLFRYHPSVRIHQGNHGIDVNPEARGYSTMWGGEMRHYPFRDLDQIRRKYTQGIAGLDAADGIHPGFSSHWRDLAALDERDELEAWWKDLQAQATVYDP